MLDDRPVHVGDPECPSGPVLSIVGRDQLSLEARNSRLLVGVATAGIGRALGFEDHPVHQVVHRLADEKAGGEIGTEEVVAVGVGLLAEVTRLTASGALNRAESG